MRFVLKLRTDSPHPCRMSWRIIKRTIVTWPVNIGVTSCPQLMSKIIIKKQHPKSRILHLQDRPLILKATNPLWFRVRRSLGLLSSTISQGKGRSRITLHSDIAYFKRRQELLIKSICCIALKNVLEKIRNRSKSGMDLEDP